MTELRWCGSESSEKLAKYLFERLGMIFRKLPEFLNIENRGTSNTVSSSSDLVFLSIL